jgi:hypothetical protein
MLFFNWWSWGELHSRPKDFAKYFYKFRSLKMFLKL